MGYAAHMVENKITYRILVRILEEKGHLEYAMYRWQKPERNRMVIPGFD